MFETAECVFIRGVDGSHDVHVFITPVSEVSHISPVPIIKILEVKETIQRKGLPEQAVYS